VEFLCDRETQNSEHGDAAMLELGFKENFARPSAPHGSPIKSSLRPAGSKKPIGPLMPLGISVAMEQESACLPAAALLHTRFF
jgi:hypothetical protein